MSRFRRTVLTLLASLVLVAAVPAPAPAAKEGPPAGEKKGHKKAEPDIFEPRLDLTIWTIVVFGVLLLVLRRFAWGPMLEVLKGREARIRGALEQAEATREETTRLREQLQAEMNKAHEAVRALMDEARRNAEAMAADLVAKGKADLGAERERLHRELRVARDQALQQIWNQAAQLATLISAKAVRRQLNEDDHRRLLDEALAEFRSAGKERQQDYDSVRA